MSTIGIWGLREEARKSWDYFVSNKVVYLAKVAPRNHEVAHVLSEKYLNGDYWFEIHWTLPCDSERESHFNVIVEVADVALPSVHSEPKGKGARVHRNGSMLVECPEFVKLPKGIIPETIPSKIRLKRVDNICHCGWKQLAPILVGSVSLLKDREVNLPFLCFGERSPWGEMRQSPRQLVQGGSEATNEVSQEHRDGFWHGRDFHPDDVQDFIKIGLLADGVGVKGPLVDCDFKRIEVFLRPAGFHFYMQRPNHLSETPGSRGTIGA